jgi:hypothetical protein
VGLTAEETAVGVRRRARRGADLRRGCGGRGRSAARLGGWRRGPNLKVSGGGARVATAAARGKTSAKSEMSARPS